MKIKFAAATMPKTGVLILLVAEGGALGALGETLDKAAKGHLRRAISAAAFEGKKDQSLDVVLPPDAGPDRALLFGVGDPSKLKPADIELIGGSIGGALVNLKLVEATVDAEIPGSPTVPPGEAAALLASGLRLRSYSFLKYKSAKPNDRPKLERATVLTGQHAAARKAFQALEAVAEGVHTARDLVNEPANVLFPRNLRPVPKR